jgi:hypothetical protein
MMQELASFTDTPWQEQAYCQLSIAPLSLTGDQCFYSSPSVMRFDSLA